MGPWLHGFTWTSTALNTMPLSQTKGRGGSPQLPFKRPQIPSNRDHKALKKGTLGAVGGGVYFGYFGGLGRFGAVRSGC